MADNQYMLLLMGMVMEKSFWFRASLGEKEGIEVVAFSQGSGSCLPGRVSRCNGLGHVAVPTDAY